MTQARLITVAVALALIALLAPWAAGDSEADAIGMTAAAAISRRLGLLSPAEERRQRDLLERFGLPVSAGDIDRAAVISAIALDKKVRAGAVRWVLLEGIGRAVLRDDVPQAVVEEALDEVLV